MKAELTINGNGGLFRFVKKNCATDVTKSTFLGQLTEEPHDVMNKEKFKTVIFPHVPNIMRFVKRFLNDEELAKDVLQEVLIILWNKRERLHEIKNIGAYAMRISRNICIDKSQVHDHVSFNEQDHFAPHTLSYSPEDENQLHENAQLVHQLIARLPELQRLTIHLRDVEAYELKDIAEILHLSQGAVRTNLCRARKKIREQLQNLIDHENATHRNIAGEIF